MKPIEVAKRYDKAKRDLKFTQKEFAEEIEVTKEHFSLVNKSNFQECSEKLLKRIDRILKLKGY